MSSESTGVAPGCGGVPVKVDGLGRLCVEVASVWAPAALERFLSVVLDPGSAQRTLHWGRNYLFVVRWPPGADHDGAFEVVVKQFRHQGLRARFRRWRRGSKGRQSWLAAQRLAALGFATPEPILFAESERLDGPSYYVSRYRPDLLELRYPLRSLAAGTFERDYPALDRLGLLTAVGALARRLHERGVWFRDFTAGNVLVDADAVRGLAAPLEAFHLLDLNRVRFSSRVGLVRRMRDLSRLPVRRAQDRALYLDGYWQDERGVRRQMGTLLYELGRRSFLFKNRSKLGVRTFGRRLADLLLPRRRPHAHIPAALPGASARDKSVWDRLSDQPHQHASKLEKLRVRFADAPTHLRLRAAGVPALLAARPEAERLARELYRHPVVFAGLGVGVRPPSGDPEPLLSVLAELGVKEVLLRCHPWEEDGEPEERLARALTERGHRLVLALPQVRELVRDPARWRSAIAERAHRLLPFAAAVQVGQAPNRSKWGLWNPAEYVELFRVAAEELRRVRPEVELLGPALIDFEPLITASFLNMDMDGLRFDALASLLYVDRRGAPENRQYGYDTTGKVCLLAALARGSRNCPSGRLWITEVNWPLREGPHSPAGRDVAVDEEAQADYLVRYALLTLATGYVERVYWWQLLAKGYGLVDSPTSGACDHRRRPAFFALRQLLRALGDATCEGRVGATAEGEHALRFRRPDGRRVIVAWTRTGPGRLQVPDAIEVCEDRDGARCELRQGVVPIGSSPVYIWLA